MTREELTKAYGEASCLVFPSRSETWGLPISEFLPTRKPMILADLPYARETAAEASRVAFFPVTDALALANTMEAFLYGKTERFKRVPSQTFAPPYAPDWQTLFNLLLEDNG